MCVLFSAGGGFEGGAAGAQYPNGFLDPRGLFLRSPKLSPQPIFIVPQYRLGVMGFLGSKQLQAGSLDGSTGNYGTTTTL